MFKKAIISTLAALIVVSAFGQDLLRYNYKRNNFVYTGAERVDVPSATPLQLKLGKVTYPDGGVIYTLRIDFVSSSAWKMPKNASIDFVLANGRNLTFKNSKTDANLVAPQGISKGGKKVFYNCGEYYLEQADLDKLLKGVSSLDATRRMTADGHVKVSFKNNEFSAALSRAYDAIDSAKKTNVTVGSNLEALNDSSSGNRTVTTKTIKVGELGVSLSYLYSAESNSESYDLNFVLPSKVTVPGGSSVNITTPRGEVIRLQQEKDLPGGEVVCYPDTEQLKGLMTGGAGKIGFGTVNGEHTVIVSAAEFASALATLYNAIQMVAVL